MIRKIIALTLIAFLFLVAPVFAGVQFVYPKFQAYDSNGNPLNAGLLYTYAANSSTAKATYSDRGLTAANTNPVVLNARGEAVVYGTGQYKFILRDSAGSLIWTFDFLDGIGGYLGGNFYFPDAGQADQGAAVGSVTVKDFVDALGATKTATIVFSRGSTGNTTDYTFLTSETITSNINCQFEQGARVSIAITKILTLPSPANIIAQPNQQIFSGAGAIAFLTSGGTEVYPEWWGARNDDYAAGATTTTVALQAAINSGVPVRLGYGTYTYVPPLLINGHYKFITGGGRSKTNLKPTAFGANAIEIGGVSATSVIGLRDFTLVGNATCGDGIKYGTASCAWTVSSLEVDGLSIQGFTNPGFSGMYLGFAQWLTVTRTEIVGNYIGVHIGANSTATTLLFADNCVIDNNTTVGFLHDGGLNTLDSVKFDSVSFESNGYEALKSTGNNGMYIFDNCYFESNSSDVSAPGTITITGLTTPDEAVLLMDRCQWHNTIHGNNLTLDFVQFSRITNNNGIFLASDGLWCVTTGNSQIYFENNGAHTAGVNRNTYTELLGIISAREYVKAISTWREYSTQGTMFHNHITTCNNLASPPTIAIQAAAGTNASATMLGTSNDSAGAFRITFGSGAWSGNAIQVIITFNKAYISAPIVILTPNTAASEEAAVHTRDLGVGVSSSTTLFNIHYLSAVAAADVADYNYIVIETR